MLASDRQQTLRAMHRSQIAGLVVIDGLVQIGLVPKFLDEVDADQHASVQRSCVGDSKTEHHNSLTSFESEAIEQALSRPVKLAL